MTKALTNEDIEFQLLLEAIFLKYGYDFRGYAEASMRRRVQGLLRKSGFATISRLQEAVLHESESFARMLPDLTVSTSEMYRDPSFYNAFREQVVPVLRTFPAFKIWHAGCSFGQELYSMAILLKEAGIYDKATIFATDINQSALQAAKEGIYPLESIKQFTANYQTAGGSRAFSDYYTAAYGSARFDVSLRQNVVFAHHNLAIDDVFSEVHVILCRNVMIYFNRDLQDRVLDLFSRSLRYKGFLCLGSKETVRFLKGSGIYEDVSSDQRIYRKLGAHKLEELLP